MSRRDLTTTSGQPTPRVIHYLDPAPRTATKVVVCTPEQYAELAARGQAQLDRQRREHHVAYTRWLARQDAIKAHDRKVRNFWLGLGAIVGLGLLAGLGWLAWAIYDAANALDVGLVAGVALAILVVTGLAAGAHRCITIIEHRH